MTIAANIAKAAALLIVISLVDVNATSAADSGATLAKCTCQFKDNGSPGSDGANAVNATLCIQTLDKRHSWCEITIACLRGNMGPKCNASANPKQELPSLYRFHAQQMTEGNGPFLAVFAPMIGRNGEAVAQLTAKNDGAISNCVDSYLKRSSDDTRRSADNVTCSFDHLTGWLAIAYSVGDQIVQFSFGRRE